MLTRCLLTLPPCHHNLVNAYAMLMCHATLPPQSAAGRRPKIFDNLITIRKGKTTFKPIFSINKKLITKMEYHIIATYGDFLKLQIIKITELQYPKIFFGDDLGGVRRRGGLLLLLKNHKIVVGIHFVPLPCQDFSSALSNLPAAIW